MLGMLILIIVGLGFYLEGNQKTTVVKNLQPNSPAISESGITIVSPRVGEVWIEGSTYDIVWTSSGVNKINISAAMGGHDLGHIAVGVNASTGKYSWKIPMGEVSSFGKSTASDIKIRVEDFENPNIYTENKAPLTVISASSTKFVTSANYICEGNKKIMASYYDGPTISVNPGEPPKPTGLVEIILSDGRSVSLPQTISGSGIRYATGDESIIFWSKGKTAFVDENNIETYSNCNQL